MSTLRLAPPRASTLLTLFIFAAPLVAGCRQYNAHEKAGTAGRDLMEVDEDTSTDPMAGAPKTPGHGEAKDKASPDDADADDHQRPSRGAGQ